MIRHMLAVTALLLGLAGCGGTAPAEAPPPLADPSFHLLVQTRGDVALKRPGWNSYAPAKFGAALRIGDLLRLDGDAQATVVCADLTVVSLPSGVGNVPCTPAPRPALMYDDSRISLTRSDEQPNYPQIITPRRTKLLSDRPMIRWTNVNGARGYSIALVRDNKAPIWSIDVGSATEIAYPKDVPALQPGVNYRMIVTAGGQSSNAERMEGLDFSLMTHAEIVTIRDRQLDIGKLKLPEPAKRFLIANLYAGNGLDAEALGELEALAASAREPAVMRALGGLYARIGISQLAESRYHEALNMSKQAGDVDGQVLAQLALSKLAFALKDAQAGAEYLNQASALYEQLGDKQTAVELRERARQP